MKLPWLTHMNGFHLRFCVETVLVIIGYIDYIHTSVSYKVQVGTMAGIYVSCKSDIISEICCCQLLVFFMYATKMVQAVH